MRKYKTTRWDRTFYGTILPSGNIKEFPHIRKNLKASKIEFQEFYMKSGGTVFVFPDTELKKLPKHIAPGRTRGYRARFLPITKDDGHAVYPITVFTLGTLPISGTSEWSTKEYEK